MSADAPFDAVREAWASTAFLDVEWRELADQNGFLPTSSGGYLAEAETPQGRVVAWLRPVMGGATEWKTRIWAAHDKLAFDLGTRLGFPITRSTTACASSRRSSITRSAWAT